MSGLWRKSNGRYSITDGKIVLIVPHNLGGRKAGSQKSMSYVQAALDHLNGLAGYAPEPEPDPSPERCQKYYRGVSLTSRQCKYEVSHVGAHNNGVSIW